MIRSFSIENFCSFRLRQEVSFVVGKSAPENTTFRDSLVSDERLSTVTGVFGPNASGKTNLLKAFSFMGWFMAGSYQEQKDSPIPVDGFKPLGPDIPSSFHLEYEIDGTLCQYSAALTQKTVLSEKLARRDPKTGRFNALLTRHDSGNGSPLQIGVGKELGLPKAILIQTLRPNASIVSTALQTGNEKLQRWVMPVMGVTNVIRAGRVPGASENELLRHATNYFHQSPELADRIQDLLQRGDMGIKDFRIAEVEGINSETGEPGKRLLPEVTHGAGDLEDFTLPLLTESSGTKRLFIILMYLMESLRTGTPAIIDEMEADLHPHMIPWILRLFTTPILNPKNAQLFFTCHSVEMLNELDKTQIYLVGKDAEDNVSVATRLDQIKGVRRDDNIFAKYNAGTYGAVPEPF